MEKIRFDEMDIMPQILRGIEEMGFEEATPIQAKAIPVVMSGQDVIGPDRNRKDSGLRDSHASEGR